MAELTLKNVLDAIAQVRGEMATKTDLAELRGEMATKTDLANLQLNVDARFDRVESALAELDKDLTGHMKVHRELEKDIELLKRRPPRTAARAPRRR